MAGDVSQDLGASTQNFQKVIRVQGDGIDNFHCETSVPVIIEGTVKNAKIKSSWIEVLPGATMSGDIEAEHLVVRGNVLSLKANVQDFFAMDSAVMESCHIIFDSVRGCSIHPQSQILGSVEFSLRPGRHQKEETPRKVDAEKLKTKTSSVRSEDKTQKSSVSMQDSSKIAQQVTTPPSQPQTVERQETTERTAVSPSQTVESEQRSAPLHMANQTAQLTAAQQQAIMSSQETQAQQKPAASQPAQPVSATDQSSEIAHAETASQQQTQRKNISPILEDIASEDNPNLEETDDGYASLTPPPTTKENQ